MPSSSETPSLPENFSVHLSLADVYGVTDSEKDSVSDDISAITMPRYEAPKGKLRGPYKCETCGYGKEEHLPFCLYGQEYKHHASLDPVIAVFLEKRKQEAYKRAKATNQSQKLLDKFAQGQAAILDGKSSKNQASLDNSNSGSSSEENDEGARVAAV